MTRLWVVGLLLAALNVASAAPVRPRPGRSKPTAVVPQGPRRPASRSEAQQLAKSGHGSKTNVRRVLVKRMVHGHLVTVSRVVRVKSGPVVPPHPDADRLREIQQAMADKGYFKGEVNGVWTADSVDALKRFQSEQKLMPDGKINALSLIGLGLGPKHDGSVAALPSEKPKPNIPQ
jgi:hypothetical protein